MIIIPEQRAKMLEELRRLKKEVAEIKDYYDNRDRTGLEVMHVEVSADYFVKTNFMMAQRKIEEITQVLRTAIHLKERVVDRIDIGTRFLFEFLGEEEVCDFILVDDAIGVKSTDGFISRHSPLGGKLLGKAEHEQIENMGRIVEIKKDPADYLHYMKEKNKRDRICVSEKERRKYLNEQRKVDESAEEEYIESRMITKSQKSLLEEERANIMHEPLDTKAKVRLGEIDKILQSRKVAIPAEDGRIGIGSSFNIVLSMKEQEVIKRVELINEAVSRELPDAYVERISSLGSQVFGLRENEKFTFRTQKGNITGMVYDIENTKSNDVKEGLTYRRK